MNSVIKKVYVHIDMDVLETGAAGANRPAVPGGLKAGTVIDCLRVIKQSFKIAACGIASYDPVFDREDIVLNAGFGLVRAVLEEATS